MTQPQRCFRQRIFVSLIFQEFGKRLYEELHNLYSSPSMIRMNKSRRMRWTEHVARMGGRRMHIGYWWEIQKERDH
jgi:hypothetical protein